MKNKTVEDLIEDIQENLILAGGRFFKQSEVKEMTVGRLLEMFVRNSVEVQIKYKPKD